MKDTGMTLFGRKVYESDALDADTPIVLANQQPVSIKVRAEQQPDGRTVFIANIKDER